METKTINGLTFLQFSNALLGCFIIDKKTKQEVFRFELYHSGKTFAYIKENYNLEQRPKHNVKACISVAF